MTDLRIVLLGGWGSGKSSAGNTILGPSVFKTGFPRSGQCEVRRDEVAGRHLTVVDSPGWHYYSPQGLQNTPEMDKLEIQNSVCLCPPGPHAVLLTVPLHKAFTKDQRVALEEHMSILSQSVWSHAIVLFTHGDRLGDTSIEQQIEAGGEDLRWLVDKCENRYHVFNNEKRDDAQVTQLMEKIQQMVAGNRGGHYEVHGDVAEKLLERKSNVEEHAHTLMTKTHRQRAVLKALFEGEHQSLPDVRLMLVGGGPITGSCAGDSILHAYVFTERKDSMEKECTLTMDCPEKKIEQTECVQQERRVADRNVRVVNCPAWSTTPPSKKIKDVLLHDVNMCSPGPHAVLVNVPVTFSFSEDDRKLVEEHMELLGDRVWRNALVLFTTGAWLGDRRVEEYIESEGEPLRWLLEKCGYRYHLLDCNKWDIAEIKELMEKVDDMVTRNRGHFERSDSREDRSVRDTGHIREGQKTRQKTPRGKQTFTAEEWNRREEEWRRREEELKNREEEWKRRAVQGWKREEEMIENVLKFVVKEPEEPALPAVRRRRHSKEWHPPSLGDGTPSETGSSYPWSPDKVYDWLLKRHSGAIAPSSGYESEGNSASQIDVMSVRDEDDT